MEDGVDNVTGYLEMAPWPAKSKLHFLFEFGDPFLPMCLFSMYQHGWLHYFQSFLPSIQLRQKMQTTWLNKIFSNFWVTLNTCEMAFHGLSRIH